MATPNPETVSIRPKKSSLGSSLDGLLWLIGGLAVFLCLFSVFGPTANIAQQQHQQQHHPMLNLRPPPQKVDPSDIVQVVDLAHEELFRATIKSCLPSQNPKCKTYIPDPKDGNPSVQRVAVISPPGDSTSAIVNHAEQVMYKHNHRERKTDADIEIIPRSNVPSYGYGKTHGLTKIIRLVPEPLTLEVTDALQAVLLPGELQTDITLQDLKAALRQILRFHCRLSHVAAHTSLISIDYLDLVRDPRSIVTRLESFLAPNDTATEAQGDDVAAEFVADDDQEGLFDAQESYGTQMLTYIQSTTKESILKILDETLLEELSKTKNLTIWPCPSFWAAGDEPEPLKMSSITKRIAKALSPDCNDPYASCFVDRDKCEARGDALCLKKAEDEAEGEV